MRFVYLLLLAGSIAYASIGQITALRGDASIVRDGYVFKAQKASFLEERDILKTSHNGFAQVKFIDNTLLTLGKNSTININEYLINGANSRVKLQANSGSYKVISGQISKLARNNFKFVARTATIGIRGTEFIGDLNSYNSKVACLKGAINLNVAGKNQRLNAGEQAEYSLDRIMGIGEFSASDFDIAKDLGIDYKKPTSRSDYINTKKGGFYEHKRALDPLILNSLIKTDSNNPLQHDELDDIMGN